MSNTENEYSESLAFVRCRLCEGHPHGQIELLIETQVRVILMHSAKPRQDIIHILLLYRRRLGGQHQSLDASLPQDRMRSLNEYLPTSIQQST